MFFEKLRPNRGTKLRRNGSTELRISLDPQFLKSIFLINETEFFTKNIKSDNLIISPKNHYMLINKSNKPIQIEYDQDVEQHQTIYDPYKYENTEKKKINPEEFKHKHNVPEGYIDILPKWYSIKFTYPDHNLIFLKPEMGISFQIHQDRSERWKIISGKPIVLNDHHIYYYVHSGREIHTPIGTYHSIINPNDKGGEYIIFKEWWEGHFDEEDIKRVYNPNHYDE